MDCLFVGYETASLLSGQLPIGTHCAYPHCGLRFHGLRRCCPLGAHRYCEKYCSCMLLNFRSCHRLHRPIEAGSQVFGFCSIPLSPAAGESRRSHCLHYLIETGSTTILLICASGEASRQERAARDARSASILRSVGTAAFLDRWYDAPMWESLRAHPTFCSLMERRRQTGQFLPPPFLNNLKGTL